MSYATPPDGAAQEDSRSMTSSLLNSDNPNKSPLTSEHLMESQSDNDVSERQTRERLKKASLGSISSMAAESAEIRESLDRTVTSTQDQQTQVSSAEMDYGEDDRGRLGKKRSLNDPATTEDEDALGSDSIDTKVGHTRKRSRDVRNGEPQKLEAVRPGSPNGALQEEAEGSFDNKGLAEAGVENGYKDSAGVETPRSGSIDEEMQEAIHSPRKKRSRDLAELDSHREQKIAATDENRARRRSSSEDRNETTAILDGTVNFKEDQVPNVQVVPAETPSESQAEESTKEIPQTSNSAKSQATGTTKPTSPISNQPLDKGIESTQRQTSPSAFASSGFAALAKSSTSPFGVLGSTTSTTKASPLSPASPFAALSSPHTEKSNPTNFGAPSSGSSSTASPFSSSNLPGFGSLGGFASTSGFGTGFGSGSKLTSFAAPTGNAKLGGGPAKPFGASTESDEEEKDSEAESVNQEDENLTEKAEVDSRFQKQEMDTGEEGEDTVFQVRGKLFEFTSSGEWAERGIGPFKLNVSRLDPEATDGDRTIRARFIMRAQLTHRVMLNTRVFKEMKLTDGRGNAPTGKTMIFSVLHDGRAVPYLFKTRNEEDIKTLHRETTKLQGDM